MSALHRARLAIAALLLMLHWAAPSLRPFDPLPGLDDSTPAYSTALNTAVTGTLPRVLARIQPLDSNAAKSGRQFWAGPNAAAALVPDELNLVCPIATDLPAYVIAGDCGSRTARPFHARAPPA